ncbi:MAG: DUF1573 domain-containing protein [Ignavibacteriales bacterium]|nr:DUF1573 domain-containing protein [Ignavibacteriales bacterium]
MKKLIVVYFLTVLSVFAQFGNPKIVPLEQEYNFGDIIEGEKVTHDFIIFNRGTDKLVIDKVKASCGCTAANPTKTELLPEDSTTIQVEFNTLRRIGPQKKFVYVFSNDPETPQLRLQFSANVIKKEQTKVGSTPDLKLSKYSHNFGNVKQGVVLNLEIEVSNQGDDKLKINEIKSSCGCTAALMSSMELSPNESSELKIKFDTKNLAGQIARTVTLFSNDPKHPSRVLTLIANIEEG